MFESIFFICIVTILMVSTIGFIVAFSYSILNGKYKHHLENNHITDDTTVFYNTLVNSNENDDEEDENNDDEDDNNDDEDDNNDDEDDNNDDEDDNNDDEDDNNDNEDDNNDNEDDNENNQEESMPVLNLASD